PLPDGAFELEITRGGQRVSAPAQGSVVRVPLTAAGTVEVALAAADHHDLGVRLAFDGTRAEDGLRVVRDDGALAGVTLGHARGDDGKPVHRLFLGLRHRWFSAE